MSNQQQDPVQAELPLNEQPETIEVENLDQFVKILTAWHSEKVQTLKHLLTVPDGAEFKVGDDAPIVLMGDMLAGFKFGVELALMQVGTLPFIAEMENEPAPTTPPPADAAG